MSNQVNGNRLVVVPISIVLIILGQNSVWPLWLLGPFCSLIPYFIVVFLAYCVLRRKARFNYSYSFSLIGLLFVFLLIPLFYEFRISSIFIILSFLLVPFISDQEKKEAFRILHSVLYYIVIVSLPLWLFHVFVLEFPSLGTIDLAWMKGGACDMGNYFFFVTNTSVDYQRFYSVFDEPGVLGTLSAFVLYIDCYDFRKKKNIVILLGGIFTYSMAFYILTAIGLLCYSFKSFKRLIITLISVTVLSVIAFGLLKDDPAFRGAVINRVFEDNANESLDGRTSLNVNEYYSKYLTSPDIVLGKGTTFLQKNQMEGASYKLFIIEYGLLGVFVLLLLYWSLIPSISWYLSVFYIIYILSFLQRPLAFNMWQILLFSCAVAMFQDIVKLRYKCK